MSQRFTIKGTDKASGKPIECVIVAEDGDKASRIAKDRGIIIGSIKPFVETGKAGVSPVAGVVPALFSDFGLHAGKVEMAINRQEIGGGPNIFLAMFAGTVSAAMHGLLILLFILIPFEDTPVQAAKLDEINKIEEPEPEPDLTITDIGNDIEIPKQYHVDRKDETSVPAPHDPTHEIGIQHSLENAPVDIPPPPGLGGGSGAGPEFDAAGLGSSIRPFGGSGGNFPGGLGVKLTPGGLGGRSGATRDKLVKEGGGNNISEACVARGLLWLAKNQADDGHWGLHNYGDYARSSPKGQADSKPAKYQTVDKAQQNDIAGTGFGLLPFLAAGITHRPSEKTSQENYSKTVEAAIQYLIRKQGKNGSYDGDIYAHPLATIAMCEAYGMTYDPHIKVSAQKALDYLIYYQDQGGSWGYSPKSRGDTSIAGWCVMALKSGQMVGLHVPSRSMEMAKSFLVSCYSDSDGGFGYSSKGSDESTTAIGLLCCQYMGLSPRNPGFLKGVNFLNKFHPGENRNRFDLYTVYYAMQVMHHMGGTEWDHWNLGPLQNGVRHNGVRDILIARQVTNNGPKNEMLAGSWDPEILVGMSTSGGRMMSTSLSLLTLEIYYRHLPLFR